jgi:hypothetical protein
MNAKERAFSSLFIGIWAAAEILIMLYHLVEITFSSLFIGIWAAA